jgi:two-component system cell cycle response regulator
MRERLLIIDAISTNRIVMKAKLSSAFYEISLAENIKAARDAMQGPAPDLIFLSSQDSGTDALDFCAELKSTATTRDVPVIITTDPQGAVAALEAGADDVLVRPFDEQIMLSRLRKLLRARDKMAALKLGDLTQSAQKLDLAKGQIAIVAQSVALAKAWQGCLATRLDCQITPLAYGSSLIGCKALDTADVIIIATLPEPVERRLKLMSDLRSRRPTRRAQILMTLPASQSAQTATALDMGADDVVLEGVSQDEFAARVELLIRAKLRADQMRARLLAGLQLASVDPLTGLHNRRFATKRLGEISQTARDSAGEFATLVLDIDHFKQINDRYGHATGDAVLMQIAHSLKSQLRAQDLIARVGGEEFLIALPGYAPERALALADRLRQSVEGLRFAGPDGQRFTITLSIGLAMSDGAEELDETLQTADRALYAAKADGRNAVRMDQCAA